MNDDELEVDDDTAVIAIYNGDARLPAAEPERFWDFEWATDDMSGPDEPAGQVTTVVSLGFLRGALQRRAKFWCGLALVGLLIGIGLFVEIPPASEASTSLLVTNNPNLPAGTPILDDQAILESRSVAGVAVRQLGLDETAAKFATTYTVTVVTDRVLQITAKAKSAPSAIRNANALAAAFLAYQDNLLQAQNQLISASLNLQVTQAQESLDALTRQVSKVTLEPSSPARTAELSGLQTKQTQATSALTTLKQTVDSTEASNQSIITAQVKGSSVLDTAAPVKESRSDRLLLYGGGGGVGGLALGLAIVLVGALLSDRLRRRDDIALAIGASVRLSVGRTRLSRWRLRIRGMAAARNANVRRIAWYLERSLQASSHQPETLAVVPVDDTSIPAVSVAALAMTLARRGKRVLLADLCEGAPAARLLRVTGPGVHEIDVDGTSLTVVIPDDDEALILGPLRGGQVRKESELLSACGTPDVVLALIALDPSLGSDDLATWSDVAVAVVTAGHSSTERIYGVGEMIRMAGVQDLSAVLIGADKKDQSLGTVPVRPSPPVMATRELRARSQAEGLAINGDVGPRLEPEA